MPALLSQPDPDGLLEYSVVYTDRALNHMSARFQHVMREISATLKVAYNAHATAVVPGSGTFGMEAVARQFAVGKKCLVVRNGWFSYRWSQIFEMGNLPAASEILLARPTSTGPRSPFAPPAIEEVVAKIREFKPDVVFAPHVETSSGIVLPAEYLRALGEAVHAVGGLFVLDCIASGNLWVDMALSNVDVLISAPQKGWSSQACCALIAMSERARRAVETTTSNSFACDLKKWIQIMETYERGGHAYHATMPTDALGVLAARMHEAQEVGWGELEKAQRALGASVREILAHSGFSSVAAAAFAAPSVIVSYTDDPDIQSGKKFLRNGLQTAAGVPLMCNEPADFRSFRIGLFGLDKLQNPSRTLANLKAGLARLG